MFSMGTHTFNEKSEKDSPQLPQNNEIKTSTQHQHLAATEQVKVKLASHSVSTRWMMIACCYPFQYPASSFPKFFGYSTCHSLRDLGLPGRK
jgi:hypothetical protein